MVCGSGPLGAAYCERYSTAGVDAEWWAFTVLLAAMCLLIGIAISKTDRASLIKDIDKAFGERVTEATIHGKRLKFNKPIVAAKKKVLAAVMKHVRG
jgi:hypothetical protein